MTVSDQIERTLKNVRGNATQEPMVKSRSDQQYQWATPCLAYTGQKCRLQRDADADDDVPGARTHPIR